MITKRERRYVLTFSIPTCLALVLILPYLENRVALGVGVVLLAMTASLMGAAIAAPVHPNRK